jgi:hypothetical protein
MEFRYDRRGDIEAIDRIWRQHYYGQFGLPTTENKIISGVVDSGEGIRGFGIVKLFAEGLFVIDQSMSLRDKIKTIELLLEAQQIGCSNSGIEQSHAFVRDANFAKILKKHFGYKDTIGECLVVNTNGKT